MKVAKLENNSLHDTPLKNGNYVNVIKDCNDNYIVSMSVMKNILHENPNIPYTEIDFCPKVQEEL